MPEPVLVEKSNAFMGWLIAAGGFLVSILPFLKWVEHLKNKKKEPKPDPVASLEKKFEEFKAENSKQHQDLQHESQRSYDDLGRVVQAAALDANNATQEIRAIASEMRTSQQDNAKEIRETLQVFKMGIDQSLGEVHEKANDAKLIAAGLEGRLKAIELQINKQAS